MKNKKFLYIVIVLILTLTAGVFMYKFSDMLFQDDKIYSGTSIIKDKENSYLGSYYKGNFVWGIAMNLAWNELNENIIHGKLKLSTNEPSILEILDSLNSSSFSKQDLDEGSYYIKSGYGQEVIDEINKEVKQKFPDMGFGDLNLTLDPTDIISYAYLLKAVEYEKEFSDTDIRFKHKKVKAFAAFESVQKRQVYVVNYKNDNKFIVKLKLKDNNDELFLAKGYDMKSPQKALKDIKKYNSNELEYIDFDSDKFKAPEIHLEYNRQYKELLRIPLLNEGFEDYYIKSMEEKIKFDMDKKGARVEQMAYVGGVSYGIGDPPPPPPPRNFILNKPYWIIMKRANSQNPYFLLGVNNTNIMIEE